MHGDEADAALGGALDALAHGLADIEHLGVEKDALALADQLVEQELEAGREDQPQPELIKRDDTVEPRRHRAGGIDRRQIERNDEPVGDAVGDGAGMGYGHGGKTAFLAGAAQAAR